ncbi:DsbA family protein [Candidatus Mycobacterium methanotrophicum]|uniref:DsbA family protein n=1 Tax=Candidatus Mycobacterium methanotrophicum TaxID=2943498 RepID=A0ABY4QTC4_9MYCO|nr:thioredoxin domain-containing protein [Candidatus Mycobacterium methanotrophicum]UQX12925.1 DsbA family protein [Candidatus Mycobacterium methanotrophicum]
MAAKAAKGKRPATYDLNPAGRRRDLLVRIGLTAIVMLFAVVLVGYIVTSHNKKTSGAERSVRVASSKLITQDGKPKADVAFYEDFLCPACGNFERTFGPTVSKLIDSGAIAADYYMLGFLSRPQNDDYSSRAANAAYCVADESIDAFRRFHTALYTKQIQPSETGTTFPDNAKLIELAREAGVAGKVPDCIKAGKYIPMVDGLAAATGIHATPTVRINGQDYQWSTPEALVAKIKEIVGDVPGLDSATPAAS